MKQACFLPIECAFFGFKFDKNRLVNIYKVYIKISENQVFSWGLPRAANTLKPYCSVGFFYYIFLIFIFFEHTQIKKQRAKASHQADNLTKLWQEFLSVLEMIRHGMRSVPTKQALARYCGLSLCPSYFEREECLSG